MLGFCFRSAKFTALLLHLVSTRKFVIFMITDSLRFNTVYTLICDNWKSSDLKYHLQGRYHNQDLCVYETNNFRLSLRLQENPKSKEQAKNMLRLGTRRQHVFYVPNNIHEKITRFWLAESSAVKE